MKSQGFVCDTGRRGVEIASLSAEHITGLYQIRAALDALAAREAALNNPAVALEAISEGDANKARHLARQHGKQAAAELAAQAVSDSLP